VSAAVRVHAVIVDNGGANVASLVYALARLGCDARVTRAAVAIREASHVFLPGVGAAGDAMQRLRASGLDTVIPRLTQPVLGICLGMQLLYEASEEDSTPCLGAIPGTARRLLAQPGRPVPHMGWNRLQAVRASGLLDGIAPGAHAYFVHSYALAVGNETLASTDYGTTLSAIVRHGNFCAAQFHPERSAATGASLLRNFLALH